ncbi:O-antigen ligase family protein [Streptomyces sp. enrichment culture]|uniref:O-antigen ligase family protein n=1 Tax=Streptomyces sp. enrichment culture TaxID=1795815 RepID=UPI003F559635
MTPEQARTTLILGILALVSLVPLLIALRRARAFGDWDLTATVVFLTAVLASAPTIAYVVHSGRSERLDVLGDVVIGFPPWVHQAGAVANGLLIAVCLLFTGHRLLAARARINTAPLPALGLVVLVALSDALHGQALLAPRQLVLLAALLAATVARPGRPAFLGGAAAVLLFTVLGGIEALVEPETVLRGCRPDNPCGLLGVHYAGVFSNENILGLVLILGIPFVWLGLRGPVRVVLAVYVAFLAVATGGMLAAATAAATLVALAVLRPDLAEQGRPSGRALLALPALGATAAVGAALPFVGADPDRFGDRAVIWTMAREELTGAPLLGLGGKAWSAKYPAGEIPAAVSPSLHNQWIDVLYAGGLAGLALFLLLLLRLLAGGGLRGLPVAACVLLPVLLSSVLERPWSFGISNTLTFALLVATLMPLRARAAPPPRVPGPAPLALRRPRSVPH